MKNKNEYEELLDRNWMIIDHYRSELTNLTIDENSSTVEKFLNYDASQEHTPKILEGSESFIKAAGYKCFYDYSKLLMNCVKEITAKEGRKNLIPKDGEKPYEWLMRVKRKSNNYWSFSRPNFELWNSLYQYLTDMFINAHNDKLSKMSVH